MRKGGAAFAGGQGARVLLGLAARTQHGFIEAARVRRRPQLLGFEDEAAALVQVDAARRGAAVAMHEHDRPLEQVVLLGRRMRHVHAEQPAKVRRETLRGGEFRCRDALPARNEGVRCLAFLVGIHPLPPLPWHQANGWNGRSHPARRRGA
jgi:hypothetical protein